MSTAPSEDDLVDAIADSTREAVTELFREHPGHHFYYCSLITTGEGHAPTLCAWSKEALAHASAADPELAQQLAWSYADSPFYGFGERHFLRVTELFAARPNPGWRDPGARRHELRAGARTRRTHQRTSGAAAVPS